MPFQLTGLRLVGLNVKAAEIVFKPGLNVISGASDTGKSYILRCIDFMCGAKTPPGPIPEAADYSRVFLGLRTETGEQVVLERSMKGGDLNLYETPWDKLDLSNPRTLSAVHSQKNNETVSAFLLNLSGLLGRQIRKNARNETRAISFRNITPFFIIEEERILTTRSPVLTGESTTKTEEISTLKLLLTGTDSAGLVAKKDPKIRKAEMNSRLQLLKELAADRERRLASLPDLELGPNIEINLLENSISEISESIATAENQIHKTEAERKAAWTEIQRTKSRRIVLKELLSRFQLLDQHYRTDLDRLLATIEAGRALSEIRVGKCPLCGAPAGDHTHAEVLKNEEIDRLILASQAERGKIGALLQDLASTVAGLRLEEESAAAEEGRHQAAHDSLALQRDKFLAPSVRDSRGELNRLLELHSRLDGVRKLNEELMEFQRLQRLTELELARKEPAPRDTAQIETTEMERFCQTIEQLLRDWQYPSLDRVVFSERHQDLVISGKDRGSQGKGLRAISYAGFTIGLMRHCLKESLPHPGLVVLDSPLVTFREPDVPKGEEISENAIEAFYISLANAGQNEQIIILENEDPPAQTHTLINYFHFSKSSVGRYGFFQQPS